LDHAGVEEQALDLLSLPGPPCVGGTAVDPDGITPNGYVRPTLGLALPVIGIIGFPQAAWLQVPFVRQLETLLRVSPKSQEIKLGVTGRPL
jgi:hypothetical protein